MKPGMEPVTHTRGQGGLDGSCVVLGEGKGGHEGKNTMKGALAAF
jgi:hypothetical protein